LVALDAKQKPPELTTSRRPRDRATFAEPAIPPPFSAPAGARASVPDVHRFDTHLTIRQAVVDPNQALNVNGTVESRWYCEQGREVRLWMRLDGPDQAIDVGVASCIGSAWAVRSFGEQADGANQFYVKATRTKLKLERTNGRADRAICRAARVPVA
jgi:hypothetical protein